METEYFLFSPGPARERVPYVSTDFPAANIQRQVLPRYAYRTHPRSLQPAKLRIRVLYRTNPKIELKLRYSYPRSMRYCTTLSAFKDHTGPRAKQEPRLARITKRVVASRDRHLGPSRHSRSVTDFRPQICQSLGQNSQKVSRIRHA